jgi:hypothetical protein
MRNSLEISLFMRRLILTFFLIFSLQSIAQRNKQDSLPGWLKGKFIDDYGINYQITDSTFVMTGSARYHILKWDEKGEFLLTQNDSLNKAQQNLYTRIDYMKFSGMEPFKWGYCFTVYDAENAEAALKAASADRFNPKKGCNGYPFSRMKRQ